MAKRTQRAKRKRRRKKGPTAGRVSSAPPAGPRGQTASRLGSLTIGFVVAGVVGLAFVVFMSRREAAREARQQQQSAPVEIVDAAPSTDGDK